MTRSTPVGSDAPTAALEPNSRVPTHVRVGQNAKYSVRVDVFRFASKLGHHSVRSALRICAKGRRTESGQPPGLEAMKNVTIGTEEIVASFV
jgi:hypothetical protein